MTLAADELRRRDARIAELEAKGDDGRSYAETTELSRLHVSRNTHWQRLPGMLAQARQRVHDLESYGRRHRLIERVFS